MRLEELFRALLGFLMQQPSSRDKGLKPWANPDLFFVTVFDG
jgi:hypothetical protein